MKKDYGMATLCFYGFKLVDRMKQETILYFIILSRYGKLFLFSHKRANYKLDHQKKTVAVIISCFNHLDYSQAAIASYYASLDDQYNYVLVIMDDHSSDGTSDYFLREDGSRFKHCCYFRYRKNMGLTQTWNDGINFSLYKLKSDYVFLINNDVLIPKGILAQMINHMSDKKVGIVGPLTNAPGHQPVQDIRQWYLQYKPSNEMTQIQEVNDRISNSKALETKLVNGFFMGFPKAALIRNIFCRFFGPYYFDPRKRNFGNEDEFQKRLEKAGFKRIIARDAFVFHYKDVSQQRYTCRDSLKKGMIFRDIAAKTIIDMQDYLKMHGNTYDFRLTEEERRLGALRKKVVSKKDVHEKRMIVLPPLGIRTGGTLFKNDAYFLNSSKAEVRRLVENCRLTSMSRVLDVGCGAGRLPIGLLSTGAGTAYYQGIDVNKASVDWCQQNIGSAHTYFKFMHINVQNLRYNPNGEPVKGDFKFSFPDQSFDIIYLFSVFTHMPVEDVRIYLREFNRLLSPKGRIFLTAFVQERVPEMVINPKGYGVLNWKGPLHCVRYNSHFFRFLLISNGFTVDRFDFEAEVDKQSAFYISKKV